MKHYLSVLLLVLVVCLPAVAAKKKAYPGGRQYIWRLTLRDKGASPYTLERPQRWLSHRAIERRRRQGLHLDSTDLPVSPSYLKELRTERSISVVGMSRWNNSVLVHGVDTAVLQRLASLPFVAKSECVWMSPDSLNRSTADVTYREQFNSWDSIKGDRYAGGREQIEMLQGQRLHALGYRGRGMVIAVLDGGFRNVDRIPVLQHVNIIGARNMVWAGAPDGGSALRHATADDFSEMEAQAIYRGIDHGTKVLSAMAADASEVLTGTAPDARYWLLRCEDQQTEQPVEEDYWVMAAEMADSAGVDIINSSLGYNEYDAPHRSYRLSDLDGQTAFISRAASMLARKGIILVNSAGNTGMGPWKKICVPADAFDILTVGAINSDGRSAPFSSVGPAQDGRVKPDVMALGSPATLISGRGTLVRDMGTSFSAPVVCGLVACLWQALPQKSALDIINLIRKTSDNSGTPDNVYGYGRPNFWRAYMVGKLEDEETAKPNDGE
jgi:subtilisin family serine protease